MCIIGEARPIPKGEVWGWKLVYRRYGGIYPTTAFGQASNDHKPFERGQWIKAAWKPPSSNYFTKAEDFGFHAYRVKVQFRQASSKSIQSIRVKLRGIIEATTEGYRARQMFIPKPKSNRPKGAPKRARKGA